MSTGETADVGIRTASEAIAKQSPPQGDFSAILLVCANQELRFTDKPIIQLTKSVYINLKSVIIPVVGEIAWSV